MKPGDVVECVRTNNYAFTHGKHYTVVEYDHAHADDASGFEWTSYVSVHNDNGRLVWCHADRFEAVT